ncbi:transglutaminase [bacterium]|nr:transglutaminase [bacterium]
MYILSLPLLLFIELHINAHPGKVVRGFPAPGKFCTGMCFDGKALWISDYQTDMIYRINPESGAIISQISSPGFWPMDLAWDGEYLWNVDKKQKLIFKIDPEDGTILRTLEALCGNPEGLAWDGKSLWVSEAKKNGIMKIDMNDGTAVHKLDGAAKSVNGLTFDGSYIWSSDRKQDEIYMIDPKTGEVIIILDAPGSYSRGLAWDGRYLWNVDSQSDSVYQMIRQDREIYRLSHSRKARVTLTHQVKVYGQGILKQMNAFIAIPWEMPQQRILHVHFSPDEHSEKMDRWHQSMAVFQYQNIPSNTTVQSVMIVNAEIFAIRYYIFPDEVGSLKSIPKDIRQLYTSNGSKYLIDDPYIQNLAKDIVGDEQNPYWMARKIFDYVRNHMEYELEGGWNVAPVVLKRGTGSCSEYTISFIALARAAGLPSRYVGSIVVRGDDASLDDLFHRWPEVYLPNYGWVPIDPQGGDKSLARDRANSIGNLSNRFLITTQGGGDSEYLGWYYNYNTIYETEPQVMVNIETFGEWEPVKEEGDG